MGVRLVFYYKLTLAFIHQVGLDPKQVMMWAFRRLAREYNIHARLMVTVLVHSLTFHFRP